MRVVANIKETSVKLWKIPADQVDIIKAAYENREWLWLVSVWNQYHVTNKICAGCPDSIDVVKAFFPDLWIQEQ